MTDIQGTEYLFTDSASYLISIIKADKVYTPTTCQFSDDELLVSFEDASLEISIGIQENESYLRMEVLSVSDQDDLDMVLWGPYLNTIDETIGETVGVVRNEQFAIGLQALNPRTLGGYPWNGNDAMPQIDIFESGDYSNLSEEGKRHVLYRVEAAKPVINGSSLQAYVRNRNRVREVKNLNHDHYLVQPYDDEGIVGSAIALFGAQPDEVLDNIEAIELGEGLPHPIINGKWAKRNIESAAAYMITNFGEEDIDKAIEYTRKAGLKYLYHPGPFKTWGHFQWNDQFPNGSQGMKTCVEKAEAHGLHMGLHTLSNFITTNDPYVTPVPNDALGKVGFSLLTKEVSPETKSIEVEDGKFFNQFKNNSLRTIQIGDELIQYGGVEGTKPAVLIDCQRGAWGTTASAHSASDIAYKLVDHPYKVFLTEPSLSIEMATTLAEIYNETGLRQISFDGLEGNRSTGMGNYGEILFTDTWYKELSPDIKDHYIADASRTSHYFWHMYSRMNWGEPWYAGFRESQQEYRLKNQAYFKRNYMPGMLGWFLLRENTSIEDIEWLLARSAAFDAGFAFVADYPALEKNGNTEEILRLIGLWESMRMDQRFSNAQKVKMEDVSREFHLGGNYDEGFYLVEYVITKGEHQSKTRQPGEPLYSTFEIETDGSQQLQFIFSVRESDCSNITLEIDNYKKLDIPGMFKAGTYLKYDGGNSVYLYDENWHELKSIPVDAGVLAVSDGDHSLTLDCQFSAEGMLKVEFKAEKERETVQ